ncbi:MAG: SDR family oxidoreductase [Nitrospirae bacterium]|nr:MAG: SDR family oxidoreductase [Nitrospirota bacterium]
MRVLVTGATGFVARHLVPRLLEAHPDAEVWGLVRWDADTEGLHPRLRTVVGDLRDGPSVAAAVRAARPDAVLHLAAASTVAGSYAAPAEVLEVNVVGQVHLLEAIRAEGLAPRVVVACSGEAYGAVPEGELPAAEDTPFRPVSPYAVSKAAQDLLAAQYERAHGLAAVRLRPFNHTGPGRPPRFVTSSLARQVAEAEAGLAEPVVEVGNLDVVRDFTDVRDVAEAYLAALDPGLPPGAYNVCSGRPVAVREVLEILLGLARVPLTVRVDPARLRPADIPALWGDPSRFREAAGWAARIPLERTLSDLLDWWRERAAGGRP